MSTLERPILCAVTGGTGWEPLALDRIAAAIAAGVDLLHVRERQLSGRDLYSFVSRIVSLAEGTRTRVLVNDRADVAIAAGAGGVHLRGDSFPASSLRAIAPAGFLIGRSVHETTEAIAVERDGGCDYLVFGTVFLSASKAAGHSVAGYDALAEVAGAVSLPVLAIGGITEERAAAIASSGAAGVAAIGLFAEPSQTAEIVARVRRMFDT